MFAIVAGLIGAAATTSAASKLEKKVEEDVEY